MDYDQNNIPKIPASKFKMVNNEGKIADVKLDTKPVGYFKDAMIRFRKNKSSVAASIIILILLLFAVFVPIFSRYTVQDRDGFYKLAMPKCEALAFLGWDGTSRISVSQAGFDYYSSIGVEYGSSAVKNEATAVANATDGNVSYDIVLDSYEKVGFVYLDLTQAQYEALQAYQNENNVQIMYPIPTYYKTDFVAVSSAGNLWYELADESRSSTGESKYHDENGKPVYVAAYKLSENEHSAKYNSLKIEGDNGGEDGKSWYVYAIKNQAGYKVRVLYSEYYKYEHGFYASFLLGANQHGQDIFSCLASGARLSFLLAISVSIINFIIGMIYGSIEGFYGGTADLIMERISDILNAVPFIVVATLFQLHLAEKVGAVWSLLFAFVSTGWLGIAYRVRTQFYRFKGSEYVLAARTLGAKDRRLIFRHILPNSLGTIITGTILIIPGVIFSESMLSYLGIVNLETSSLTSIGTMLSNGQAYLSTYPHIILAPAIFISLLEISFNLFGNGLRDAFNPALRGSEE